MGEFFSSLLREAGLAFVFLLMCSPFALIPILYFLQYVSYFPRFYLGRIRLAAKLEKITRRYDLEFYRHREGYYYGRLEDTDCEFSLTTPKARYAVKLIGFPNRHLDLYLTDTYAYYIRRPALIRYSKRDSKPLELHEIPPHRYFVSDERARKEDIVPILLINPCPHTLYYTPAHSHEHQQPYDGDAIGGATLYTLTGFLRRIEADCREKKTF